MSNLTVDTGNTNAPRIIDTDVHNTFKSPHDLLPYLPRAFHKQWMSVRGGPHGGYYGGVNGKMLDAAMPDGGPAASDPHYVREQYLQPMGIDYAILNIDGTLAISIQYDPDYGNAVASACNDWMADVWLKASPHYKGSVLINHSDIAAAVKEIERWEGHPDFVQVIMCGAARIPYGQRYYHPLYEAAERCGFPIAIHPGPEGNGIMGAPTPVGYPTRYMEWHNILPLTYMAHVNSLVLEGVFEKYPGLNIVAIEGGMAWLPHLMWRMNKNYKALRSTVPWLKQLPSEYIRQHLYLTTQPIEEPDHPEQLNQIVEMIGPDAIMFSSDYAHWDFDNPKVALNAIHREHRYKIFAGNAAKLYNLHERPATAEDAIKGVSAT